MGRVVRIGVLVPALLVLATGCATKGWVRELFVKKEAEIEQRFNRVEVQVSEEAQRVEGIGSQVKGLETSVGQVGEVAKGAQGRAETALAKAEEADSRLTRLWSTRHKRNLVETIHVQFGFDRWDLNDAAQTALLSFVKELRENPKLTVDLEGYTDSVGTRNYNVQLSQRRVEAVRRYLVEKGVELSRINFIGLGPLPRAATPAQQAKNRRVTVKLMVDQE